jgi:hypothetical protein
MTRRPRAFARGLFTYCGRKKKIIDEIGKMQYIEKQDRLFDRSNGQNG